MTRPASVIHRSPGTAPSRPFLGFRAIPALLEIRAIPARLGTLALVGALLVGVSGCDDAAGPDPDAVEVRVRNASARPMADVLVWFPYEDGQVQYGDLGPGQTSEYEAVEEAYRYAYVRAVVDGDTLVMQPIDYVGETPLDPGRYTYRLGLYDGTSLTLELEPSG